MDYETPKRTSLVKDAQKRADSIREPARETTTSLTSPPPQHPLEFSHSTPSPAVLADKARTDWRNHGSGVSQQVEDKRLFSSDNGIVVRVISTEERVDASGASYTSYVLSVLSGESQFTIEHRYGEFAKLHALLRKYGVVIATTFPAKHWAGRMGHWTPSRALAPSTHDELVSYRKIQLDLWLVDVVHMYNQDLLLEETAKTAIYEFVHNPHRAPCQDENTLVDANSSSSLLAWSNPLSFTLGSSIRQATRTIEYMMMANHHSVTSSDQSIPLDLLQQAQGLCFLTVVKAGLVFSGRVGTGLIIAKGNNASCWSAPSALGTVGVGWGAQVGGDITHYLVVLTTVQAVEAFCGDSSITLGAEMDVAVGPLGRGANISSSTSLQPAYAYAHSQGLFVGMSLEGSILTTRHDVNAKFYGAQVEPRELLFDSTVAPPRAAEPLYDAIQKALQQEIPQDGFRPSQLWKATSSDGKKKKEHFNSSSTTTTANGDARQQTPTIATLNSGQASLFDTLSPT